MDDLEKEFNTVKSLIGEVHDNLQEMNTYYWRAQGKLDELRVLLGLDEPQDEWDLSKDDWRYD